MSPVKKYYGMKIWDEAYLRTKWYLDPSSCLATPDIGRKLGDVPLWGELGRGLHPLPLIGEGELGPHLTVPWAEAYLHTKWHADASSLWSQ